MQLEKNRSSLVAAFLDGWLEGRYSEPEVAEQLGYLGISIPEPYGVTVAAPLGERGEDGGGAEWTRTCSITRRRTSRGSSSSRSAR